MSKLTKATKGQSCIRCGNPNATASHYNGPRQHSFGKGRGIKASDLMTADFCYTCDQIFSEGSTSGWVNKWDRSEEFLYYISLTNIRRLENSILTIGG